MTSYFDPVNTAHLGLVTKGMRGHDDLTVIAAQAERDVIGRFTSRFPSSDAQRNFFGSSVAFSLGNGYYVTLEGFNPDASLATDAALVVALRDTIAEVVNWRLAKQGESRVLQTSAVAAGQQKTPRGDINNPFPPGDWDWRLRRWDRRELVAVI